MPSNSNMTLAPRPKVPKEPFSDTRPGYNPFFPDAERVPIPPLTPPEAPRWAREPFSATFPGNRETPQAPQAPWRSSPYSDYMPGQVSGPEYFPHPAPQPGTGMGGVPWWALQPTPEQRFSIWDQPGGPGGFNQQRFSPYQQSFGQQRNILRRFLPWLEPSWETLPEWEQFPQQQSFGQQFPGR